MVLHLQIKKAVRNDFRRVFGHFSNRQGGEKV
nr:MAG TPA: hypothetical protein [Caudoviricetes sp.]